MTKDAPYLIERIVAALTYLTMGVVGFIWLIIALFTKARLRPFLQYHIFQSIFISLGFTLLSMLIGWVSNLLSMIPLINTLVAQITFLLNMPLIHDYSLLQSAILLFLLYLAFGAFMGKRSYIPWISEIIDQNVSG